MAHLPRPLARRSEPASATIPANLQAASDGGDVDKVTELLAALNKDSPEHGLSKSQQKKLLKDAQIAQKKLAKGGGAAPKPQAAAGGGAAAASAQPPPAPTPSVPAPPPPAPTGSGEGLAGADERELVMELLAAIEGLGLPADAMAKLRSHEAHLASALSPSVSAMRNAAYTAGFGAK